VALSVVFRHFLDLGRSGLWIEWFDFAGQVQSGYSRREGQATPDELIKAAQETDVLLMDDLGDIVKAEKRVPVRETDDRRRILWQVIGKRHAEDLTTLVTTNLNSDQLYAHFDGRTMDRLLEMSFWCPMNGQNLRKVAL
jgi:DNA replication protein DnaC